MGSQRSEVQGTVESGAAERLTIEAEEGWFLRLLIEPRGTALTIRLTGPQDRNLLEWPVGDAQAREILLSWIASPSPELGLLISVAPDALIRRGEYRVRILEHRPARPDDALRLQAQDLYLRSLQPQQSSTDERIRNLTAALRLWESLDAVGEASAAHLELARARLPSGNSAQAEQEFREAIRLARAADAPLLQSSALYRLAQHHSAQGRAEEALDFFGEAAVLRRQSGDLFGESLAVHNQAAMLWMLGRSLQAVPLYRQALHLRQGMDDRLGVGYTYYGLGVAFWSLGQDQPALDHYHRALEVWREQDHQAGVADVLNNIGLIRLSLEDRVQAVEDFQRSLELWKTLGQRSRQGYALNNLGMAHAEMDRTAEARESYRQALSILKELGDRRGLAYALHNLGRLDLNSGQSEQALQRLAESLRLKREIGDRFGEAYTLDLIGQAHRRAGRFAESRRHYRLALDLRRQVGDKKGEVVTLGGLARLDDAQGRLKQAAQRIDSALAMIERLRLSFNRPELRTGFFASHHDYYAYAVDLRMRQLQAATRRKSPDARTGVPRASSGEDDAQRSAFELAERAHARTLLDILSTALSPHGQHPGPATVDTGFESGKNSPEAEQEAALRSEFDARAERAARLSSAPSPDQKRLQSLTDLEEAEQRLADSALRLRSGFSGRPIGLRELQEEVLGPDEVLIEFSLGLERSYAWAVTKEAITSTELPSQAQIDQAARQLLTQWTQRNQDAPREQATSRLKRIGESDQDARGRALKLGSLLLGPLLNGIKGHRLLIVTDGALRYLPFSALRLPGPPPEGAPLELTDEAGSDGWPLIARWEVVHLPSASTLARLREMAASRVRPEKTLAVVADPVYSARDPRVKAGGRDAADSRLPADSPLARRDWLRLRFSRREAESITQRLSSREGLTAFDFQASLETVLNGLRDYRYVHFATHAWIDSSQPFQSGIILSLVDPQGRPQAGVLGLSRIYGLSLNSDLVVLSSCSTALGKEVRGEGLLGLTRGFLHAGSSGVVASLWDVEDRATAEFMDRFYRFIAEGQAPAAALRRAQLESLAHHRWSAPYHWAAFALQGESARVP